MLSLLHLIQAYMFKYDSTHGVYKESIKVLDESTLEINGKQIKVSSKRYYPAIVLTLGASDGNRNPCQNFCFYVRTSS